MNKLCQNDVWISGEIINSNAQFDHEEDGVDYYRLYVSVTRKSGIKDTIPVIFTDEVLSIKDNYKGCFINFQGNYISRDDGSKLVLQVLAKAAMFMPQKYYGDNYIEIEGFICKNPKLRNTPLGRTIADIIIAVNDENDRASYIPCIIWNEKAPWASRLAIGTKVFITGRVQSREYKKNGKNRIAYEVSANTIDEVRE